MLKLTDGPAGPSGPVGPSALGDCGRPVPVPLDSEHNTMMEFKGRIGQTTYKSVPNLEDETRRLRATRRQLARSFEEINGLYETVERLQRCVQEKAREVQLLEARRSAMMKNARELERDRDAARQARKELGRCAVVSR
jgi:predicted RNase H-like nuclease (RuvC/YqgF family)